MRAPRIALGLALLAITGFSVAGEFSRAGVARSRGVVGRRHGGARRGGSLPPRPCGGPLAQLQPRWSRHAAGITNVAHPNYPQRLAVRASALRTCAAACWGRPPPPAATPRTAPSSAAAAASWAAAGAATGAAALAGRATTGRASCRRSRCSTRRTPSARPRTPMVGALCDQAIKRPSFAPAGLGSCAFRPIQRRPARFSRASRRALSEQCTIQAPTP
jgi:hypothetical protein